MISVIASAAKQYRAAAPKAGLLRRARNDGFGILSYRILSILGVAWVIRLSNG
jgi:hypothetical protein